MPVVPAKTLPRQQSKPASLVDRMKQNIKESGQSKRAIVSLREGEQVRMRFLVELDSGVEIAWHEHFDEGVCIANSPCAFHYGKSACKFCDETDPKTSKQFAYYVWPVFVYYPNAKKGEARGEVKLVKFKATSKSPANWLITHNTAHGTITDCDMTLERQGTGFNTTYLFVSGVQEPFRIKGVKVPTQKQVEEIIAKAFDSDLLVPDADEEDADVEDEEDDEDVEDVELEEDDEDEDEEDAPVAAAVGGKPVDDEYSALFAGDEDEEGGYGAGYGKPAKAGKAATAVATKAVPLAKPGNAPLKKKAS